MYIEELKEEGELQSGEEGNSGVTVSNGWDELKPLDEPKPSLALANIQAAPKRPVSQPVSQTKPPSSRSTARPAKEDDDLWGSIVAPTLRTISKLLNVKSSAATTRAKQLSASRGRGSKAAVPKLGAQRTNQTSSTGM
ncbi:putative inactive serine/threonine-protein kinase scy1 isoform X2 [Cucumis melo var. makuwa]|uniref:Inactive serine/threonine-protein kinase scy1 isoform X2 n=1 Tax=Cucumis melo var. makuwa TaxID=1194695 RepID=A0A5A7TKD7_CUCMM|nr:putative inactive serine/threonine-protein kinase scy1 isoform X2 [Cucumis melo var. makuwa]TYK17837.1 putative inactive serine/threonine-protein kinase scy1 isoform X2 [Cucumis melo var. makuwa]